MASLRFISWNIESLLPALGIVSGKARGARLHLLEIMAQLSWPDALCLQEVRVRPQDDSHVAAMAGALPGYECHYTLCSDPQNGKFRGGRTYGVASYVRAELGARPISSAAWDREGRVVGFTLPQHALAVYNVYAVNGTDRPHFDHELGHFSGDRHAFKRRFQAELISHVRQTDESLGRVLLGDWNVSRTALDTWPRFRSEYPHSLARAMFNETLMPALDVVDVFRTLHPDERAYSWFNRLAPPGKLDAARVDFALVASALVPRVRYAGISQDETQRFHSDHAPVELVLEI